MIRVYTTNDGHADALKAAAALKQYEVEALAELDGEELATRVADLSVLVFDLTGAALSAGAVINALDTQDSEVLPPVLYLLSTPADIEFITSAGSIINQDYAFVPLKPEELAGRLEVLTILGARRKLTMETAITDRLTGLYNRKYFIRRLEEELYRSVRYGYTVGVLMVEVDFEALGHELTEEAATVVFQEIGSFFKGRLRKSDIVARFRWDDFAVLLPDIVEDDSLAVAHDVKAKLELMRVVTGDLEITIRAAVGHLSFPVEGIGSALEVVAALEDSCFGAKTSGSGVTSYAPPV